MYWGCEGSRSILRRKPEHLNVDRAVIDLVVVHTARLEQLISSENSLRRGEQRRQQIELAVRQNDVRAGAALETPGAQVELELGEPVGANLPLARAAPGAALFARRSTVRIRANSSRGLKGLVR